MAVYVANECKRCVFPPPPPPLPKKPEWQELHWWPEGHWLLRLYVWWVSCWWRSWLRHHPTSRKVAGPIPDGVIGIFHWINDSGLTMALGSTQQLTEMSTRNINVASAKGWQPHHVHVPTVLKSGNLRLLETSWPVQACNVIA
jgi:hypothetical protein